MNKIDLIKTLEILHRDCVIECNQYQGGDFNNLLNRINEVNKNGK